jgi:hypothetical protein
MIDRSLNGWNGGGSHACASLSTIEIQKQILQEIQE